MTGRNTERRRAVRRHVDGDCCSREVGVIGGRVLLAVAVGLCEDALTTSDHPQCVSVFAPPACPFCASTRVP